MSNIFDWARPVSQGPLDISDWAAPGIIDIPSKPSPKPLPPAPAGLGPAQTAAWNQAREAQMAGVSLAPEPYYEGRAKKGLGVSDEDYSDAMTRWSPEQYNEILTAQQDPIEQLPWGVRSAVKGAENIEQSLVKTKDEAMLAAYELSGMWDEARNAKKRRNTNRQFYDERAATYAIAHLDDSEIGQMAEQVFPSVAEYLGVSLSTGGYGVLPYLFNNSARESYYESKEAGLSDTEAAVTAALQGSAETAITATIGKLLGAGIERGLSTGAASIVAQRMAPHLAKLNKPARALVNGALQSGAEGIEEGAVETAKTTINAIMGVPNEGNFSDRFWSSVAGGAMGGAPVGVVTAGQDLEVAINKLAEQTQKTTTETTQAIEAVAAYEGEGDLTTRRTFERVTGLKNTTKKFRESVVQAATEPVAEEAGDDFGSWFKGSKVVDAEGKPLVVYHGTDAEFDEFDLARRGQANSLPADSVGFFFSDSEDVASQYTPKQGGRVVKANLSLKNPYIEDFEGSVYYGRTKSGETLVNFLNNHPEYDGVIIKNAIDTGKDPSNIYVAIDPSQIKQVSSFPEQENVASQETQVAPEAAPVAEPTPEPAPEATTVEPDLATVERIERERQEAQRTYEEPAPETATTPRAPTTQGSEDIVRAIQTVVPGSVVAATETGLRVELPNGQSLSVETVKDVSSFLTESDIVWNLKANNLEDTPENRAKLLNDPNGSFVITTKDGEKISGMAIIRLAARIRQTPKRLLRTLRHELFHAAHQLGFITDAEFDALRKKYAPKAKTVMEAEEALAEASELWEGERGLTAYLKEMFDRLLAAFGIKDLSWQSAQNVVARGDVFSRQPKNLDQARKDVKTSLTTALSANLDPDSPNISLSANTDPDRYLDRANISTDTQARQAMSEHDVAHGPPNGRSREVAAAEAQQRLAADYDGELNRFITEIEKAEAQGTVIPMDEADTNVARMLLHDLGIRMLQGDEEARKLHRTLNRGYRDSRSEAARTLGLRDPLIGTSLLTSVERRKSAIAEAMTEDTKDAKKKRRKGKHDEADELSDEAYKRIRDVLVDLGWDLSDIDEIAKDPEKTTRLLQDIKTQHSGITDMLYEYWKNAILSGPHTQMVNIGGNFGFSTGVMTVERFGEALVNLFVKDPKGAQLGEFKYMLRGLGPGMYRGWYMALQAWRTESAAFQVAMRRAETQFEQGTTAAIPNKYGGRYVRIPYRMLLFVDEFAKTTTATMEVGVQAYRIAKAEGLKGEAIEQRIAELTNDIDSDAWTLAIDKSVQMAFQGKGGVASQAVQRLGRAARQYPGARWLIPFLTTPANIFEVALRRTPILGVLLDYADARHNGHKMADSGISATIARQTIAIAGMALLYMLNDPEDPWITGSKDMLDPKKRDIAYRRAPPMSFRIPGTDTWISYARIEPFATAIGFTVDMINSDKEGDALVGTLRGGLAQTVDKTYLQSLGDVQKAYEVLKREGTLDGVAEWSSNFAASWVPNIVRQTSRNAREEMAERRVWGKEDEYYDRLARRTIQNTELRVIPDFARYDVWGRPIKNHPSDGAATDMFWRIVSPIKTFDESKVLDVDKAIYRWNAQNPDKAEGWLPIQPYYREKGETHYLTDEQYAEYSRVAGELAFKYVQRIRFDPDNPTESQIEKIVDAVRRGRANARKKLKPSWKN